MDWISWSWPAVGAVIGWLTNVVAIRMLFRPRQPVKLPLLRTPWQGLLPRRHAELAQAVAETVEKHLLSTDRLMQELDLEGMKADIVRSVSQHVEERLRQQLPRFIPAAVRTAIEAYVTDLVRREAVMLVERVTADAQQRLRERVQLGKLVQEKILSLDLAELEVLVNQLARRELRHIEHLGGVLGFFVGLAQLVIAYLVGM